MTKTGLVLSALKKQQQKQVQVLLLFALLVLTAPSLVALDYLV